MDSFLNRFLKYFEKWQHHCNILASKVVPLKEKYSIRCIHSVLLKIQSYILTMVLNEQFIL